MSSFSECLTTIFKRRNLTSAEVARMCEMNVTTIWEWREGKHLPANWKRIEPIIQRLRLTEQEQMLLREMFVETYLGREEKNNFFEILASIQLLGEKKLSVINGKEVTVDYDTKSQLDSGVKELQCRRFETKKEWFDCVQTILVDSAYDSGDKLYLKLNHISVEMQMLIQNLCVQNSHREIEIVICKDEEQMQFKTENLRLLRHVLAIIEEQQMRIYTGYKRNTTGQAEQNWMILGEYFVQFTNDLNQGMIIKDLQWVQYFETRFEKMKAQATPLLQYCCDSMSYVKRTEIEPVQVNVIEFMPCIGIGLTEDIVERYIYQELPGRAQLVESLIQSYVNAQQYVTKMQAYFQKEGLVQFMETGKIEIFPYAVYAPIGLADRCRILENMISILEQQADFGFYALYDGFAMSQIHLEQRIGKENRMFIEMYFNGNEQVEIENEEVKASMGVFFDSLKEVGFAYGKEETLEFMKGVLAEYRGKV